MSVRTVQTVSRSGLNLTDALSAADSGGDSWANTGTEYLAVSNGGGSSVTLTLNYAGQFDGQSPANRTVSVAAGKLLLVGPFPQALHNDASQRASVSYSSAISVTVAVVRLS